jgi:hypothetical protein
MGEAARTAYRALGPDHPLTQTLLANYEGMTKAVEDAEETGDIR